MSSPTMSELRASNPLFFSRDTTRFFAPQKMRRKTAKNRHFLVVEVHRDCFLRSTSWYVIQPETLELDWVGFSEEEAMKKFS